MNTARFLKCIWLFYNIIHERVKNWDVNNLYDWIMSQNLQLNSFEWIEDTSKFIEDFIKSYKEKSDDGYFIEVDVQYPKI